MIIKTMMLLSASRLSYRYPGSTSDSVKSFTVNVPAGITLTIIGDNGSGKTTIGRILCGVLAPTDGCVKILGVDPSKLSAKERVKSALFLPQKQWDYFRYRSVEDEIRIRSSTGKEIPNMLDVFQLEKYRHVHPLELPEAAAWRLSILIGLISNASLLVIDEIPSYTSNLVYAVLREVLLERNKAGKSTIILLHRSLDQERFPHEVICLK